MRCEFILNPSAGNGYAGQVMNRLANTLDSWRMAYNIHQTEYPGHAKEIARSLSALPADTTVISVGGDGTASEVAAGLAGTRMSMGIIPAGTGNDFVKTVRIPKKPEEAMRFMLDRPPRPVDTGTINGEFFLNVCGTGFDVTVLDCAEEKKSKYRGLLPYMLGLLQAIRVFEPVRISVEYEREKLEKELLVCSVANGKYIGGGIPICPAADAHDGKLNLVMIDSVKRWKIPFYLPGLMLSRDLKFRITRHVLAERVIIAGKGLRFNIDGEIRKMDRAEFRVFPHSLMLIC